MTPTIVHRATDNLYTIYQVLTALGIAVEDEQDYVLSVDSGGSLHVTIRERRSV
jgi:hypothetical protein